MMIALLLRPAPHRTSRSLSPRESPRSIKWTPDWLAWTVDEIVFRNLTNDHTSLNRIPWRPMSFRLILHTQNGSLVPAPDGHVFLRRIAFTPFAGTTPLGLDHAKCASGRCRPRTCGPFCHELSARHHRRCRRAPLC